MSRDGSRSETFYTPLVDCLRWAIQTMVVVVLVAALVTTVQRLFAGHPIALTARGALNMAAVVVVIGVVLGGLIFIFGWMGRASVDGDGIDGPHYSGIHEFVAWSDIKSVERGSLSGWPCTIVYRKSGEPPIYLMVLGKRRKDLAASIAALAPPGNPLAEYMSERWARAHRT